MGSVESIKWDGCEYDVPRRRSCFHFEEILIVDSLRGSVLGRLVGESSNFKYLAWMAGSRDSEDAVERLWRIIIISSSCVV